MPPPSHGSTGTALDLTGLDPGDRHSYRQVAARGWIPAHGTQTCPACLAETGAWQTAWRLLTVTTYTRHGMLLVAECPACKRPFRDQRHSHLRRVGASPVCGNPLGDGPTHQCHDDLTTIATTPSCRRSGASTPPFTVATTPSSDNPPPQRHT